MLTENAVVEAVADHLRKDGWAILRTSTTTQHGIDILAQKDDEVLAVEAKGGGSAREGSARYGQHFTANQKRTHVAVAVLTAIQVISDGTYRAALAFPDDSDHSLLITKILPALRTLGVRVFLVRPDRTVHLVAQEN